MRIVHLTSAHPWNDTRILTRMCATLASNGHDVHLVVPVDDPPAEKLRRNVKFHMLPRPQGRIARMTITCWRVLRTAMKIDGDVYQFHDPELMPVGLILQRLGKKVIYDIHEHHLAEVANKSYLPGIVGSVVSKIVGLLSTFAVRRYSGIITAGEDITTTVADDARDIETIQNFPDLKILDGCVRADIDLSPDEPCIAFFGGIRPNPIAVNVVKAIGLIPEERQVRLLLGGAIHDQSKYQTILDLPGWARTEYVGHLEFEEMLQRLNGACCAINLYANEANAQNVRSNRLFESLAMRLPVITPNFPNWRELVDANGVGITVDPDSPEEIAAAIMEIINAPEKAREMGARGRKMVEQSWSWQNEYPKLERLYERIVSC